MSHAQAKPLLHNSSLMEYKTNKIKDNFWKYHKFCKLLIRCFVVLQKPAIHEMHIFSLLMFVLWDCV